MRITRSMTSIPIDQFGMERSPLMIDRWRVML